MRQKENLGDRSNFQSSQGQNRSCWGPNRSKDWALNHPNLKGQWNEKKKQTERKWTIREKGGKQGIQSSTFQLQLCNGVWIITIHWQNAALYATVFNPYALNYYYKALLCFIHEETKA
jgi:hypothetical protein